MSEYTTHDIRNVALLGHAGSGKTTLTESLLHAAGAIQSTGTVEKGSTVSDSDPLEKKHQHSLRSSVVNMEHDGCHINLIDTPGYPDFIGQTLCVLPAVETAAIVINANTGIQTMTRRLMETVTKRKQCRMIIINHIDDDDVDLEALLNDVRENFGSECLAINLPAGGASQVVDCFFNPSGEADFSSVEDAHTAVTDQTVEVDEDLMEAYLEQGEIGPDQLHDAFEKALREGHLVPVCFVSATTGTGIKELLDVFAKLMPNPAEGNAPPFVRIQDEKEEPARIEPDPEGHIIGHVYKIAFDPYVGKLGLFRIHQGTVTKDSELFVGDSRKAFKVGHLFKMQGDKHVEISTGVPGDLCAIAKVNDIHFDALLHNFHDEDDLALKPISFPMPLAGLAINPSKRGEEQKLAEAMDKMSQEDPCIKVERAAAANETVLRGLGELHLRTALERMEEVFNITVDTKVPTIPYRETVTRKSEGHHRHKKQSGGAGQFGEVYLRIEPLPRGSGFNFVDKVVGGVIPHTFILSVEKGIRHAYESGAIAGFPMQDIQVEVYDGKHHAVDSNEISFLTAGRKAFVEAVAKAKPIVLEPIVEIQVTVPNANMGDVTGDLSSRRGRVSNTDVLSGGLIMISGQVPLAELDDYQSKLKSMTGGEGSYTMRLSHYDPIPAMLQKELVKRYENPED
jgi:elongation factor G